MALRVRPAAVVNGYSAGSTPVPGAQRLPKLRPSSRSLAAQVAAGPVGDTKVARNAVAAAAKALPEVKGAEAYQRGATKRREGYEASGGRANRVDAVHPNSTSGMTDRSVGHGMTLSDLTAQGMMHAGASPAHVLDTVRGTSMMADPAHAGTSRAGSGEKVPRTLLQGTPNINQKHDTPENIVPGRRWEDLHPDEQAKTLERVKQYGTTPEKMESDLTAQVLSAHARSGRNGAATPYSAKFYEGPSSQRDKIEEGADEVMQHPAFQATGMGRDHARAMVAVANAATSPRAKFQSKDRFPNHEAAMHAVRSSLNGVSPELAGATKPQGLAVFKTNIAKATHLTNQMLDGKKVNDLTLPTNKAGVANKAFDPTNAPKTTDYSGAWIEPVSPDSRYVSDVHSTHSLVPHLSTEKSVVHSLPGGGQVSLHPHDKVPRGATPVMEAITDEDGKPMSNKDGTPRMKKKTASSESEEYLAGNKVGLSALHDHVARKVAVKLGLSHDVNNAGATHYLQASDWGEEQINRPDIEQTEKLAYGRDARDPLRVPAGNERVSDGNEPRSNAFHVTPYVEPKNRTAAAPATRSGHFSQGAGGGFDPEAQGAQRDKQERAMSAISAATQSKRSGGAAGRAKRTAAAQSVDPNYRSDGW